MPSNFNTKVRAPAAPSQKVAIMGPKAKSQRKKRSSKRRPTKTSFKGYRMHSAGGLGGISHDGLCFLKCAFAAPDFDQEDFKGIPDQFSGKTIMKRVVQATPYTFKNGTKTVIIVPPMPGFQYFQAEVPAGASVPQTQQFIGVPITDYPALFPNASSTAGLDFNVTKFRNVSQSFEIVPMMNEMTWAGTITSFKIPATMNTRLDSGEVGYTVQGLESVNSFKGPQYVSSFRDGVYAIATNTQLDFAFNNFVEGLVEMPINLMASDFGQLISANNKEPMTGWGNLDTIVIIVTIPEGAADQSAVLRNWSCTEYSPTQNGSLIDYASGSPKEDRVALEAYRHIIKNLPVAVPYHKNAGFWDFIKKLLGGVSAIAKPFAALPGPYGPIAGGVSGLAGLVSNL